MKRLNITLPLSIAAIAVLGASSALAQDGGLGRGKRGGGGGGGGSSPPRTAPPRQDPPRREAPPQRADPPRRNDPPSRSDPSPSSPPASPGPSSPGPLDRGRDRTSPTYPSGGTQNGRPQGRDPFGNSPIRVGTSRSGRVNYGTDNNGTGAVRPFRVDRAPVFANGNALPGRVYRQDRVGVVDGYRIGYYHYNRNFRDDYFSYPFYTFSPFGYSCVSSPFYGYSFVPGYLSTNRVVFVSNYQSPWLWSSGFAFNWNNVGVSSYSSGWGNYGNSGYDQGYDDGYRRAQSDDSRESQTAARNAIADLRDAFEDGDPRLLSRLVARRGQVAILRDGRYDYSVSVDDFDDLIRDLVTNSRTRSYQVEDTRAYRNQVRVVARHDYVDPWGERQTMYHHILLEPERGSYVIREFGTSPTRYW